jgi:hypothetical protein
MFKSTYKLIVIFFIIFLIFPITTLAWTWQDIFVSEKNNDLFCGNYLSSQQKDVVESKYDSWSDAINENDLDIVLRDEVNFKLNEEEANYMLSYHVENCHDPYFSSAKFDFKKDFIRLEGYLLKPLNGSFSLDFIVYEKDNGLELEVLKTKYRNVTVPNFLINKVISKSFKPFTATIDNYMSSQGNEVSKLSFHLDEDSLSLHIR